MYQKNLSNIQDYCMDLNYVFDFIRFSKSRDDIRIL